MPVADSKSPSGGFLDLLVRAPTSWLPAAASSAPHGARRRVAARVAGAAIDVSDGLCQDLGHVLAASGAGARVDTRLVPLSQALIDVAGAAAARNLALAAGDDYELLFTVAPDRLNRLRALTVTDTMTEIGVIEAEPGPAARRMRERGRRFRPAIDISRRDDERAPTSTAPARVRAALARVRRGRGTCAACPGHRGHRGRDSDLPGRRERAARGLPPGGGDHRRGGDPGLRAHRARTSGCTTTPASCSTRSRASSSR